MKDKIFFAFFAAVIIGASLYLALSGEKGSGAPVAVSEISTAESSLAGSAAATFDLNLVTSDQLCTIDGIGEKTAAAIVAFREENGGFTSVDELERIDGIGSKTVEKLRFRLYVGGSAEQSQVIGGTQKTDFVKIDLNSGTLEDFMTIPIITEEQATEIIKLRNKISYFSHYYELAYAEGFSDELVAKMADYVCVGENPAQ